MLRQLIDILNSEDFKDGDQTIKFAKGSDKGITNLKELIRWLRK